MSDDSTTRPAPSEELITELLGALDTLFGRHPGFRAVHAKGGFCSGTFTPSPEASSLTDAPHASRPSTRVVVRFSDFAGVPHIPDNDPAGAGPRGCAVRFYLDEHVHTDIIAHSHDGFPVTTGEEFLEFARALATSGPEASKPTPIEQFAASHPKAKQFLEAPKPIPTSFARESYFAVAPFRFTNGKGESRFGRFRILPELGNEYLSAEQAREKLPNFLFDELRERIRHEPIKLKIVVQLANEGDVVDDAATTWPNDREQLEFGTVVLNSREDPRFPELWKIIFDPIPRVQGIEPAGDPLIDVRAAIYLMSGRRRRADGVH